MCVCVTSNTRHGTHGQPTGTMHDHATGKYGTGTSISRDSRFRSSLPTPRRPQPRTAPPHRGESDALANHQINSHLSPSLLHRTSSSSSSSMSSSMSSASSSSLASKASSPRSHVHSIVGSDGSCVCTGAISHENEIDHLPCACCDSLLRQMKQKR